MRSGLTSVQLATPMSCLDLGDSQCPHQYQEDEIYPQLLATQHYQAVLPIPGFFLKTVQLSHKDHVPI